MQRAIDSIEFFDSICSSAEFLCYLFERKKKHRRGLTISSMSKTLGFSSRSNLSEILNGKRLLPKKYCSQISSTLSATEEEKDYLSNLIDYERKNDPVQKKNHLEKLEKIRIRIKFSQTCNTKLISPLEAEIFCAIGIFGGRASLEQLTSFFNPSVRNDIKIALENLLSCKRVKISKNGSFSVAVDHLVFSREDSPQMKAYLSHCFEQGNEIFKNTKWESFEDNYFESIVISVNKKKYLAALAVLKKHIKDFVSEVESEKSDALIRMNIQIFPRNLPVSKI